MFLLSHLSGACVACQTCTEGTKRCGWILVLIVTKGRCGWNSLARQLRAVPWGMGMESLPEEVLFPQSLGYVWDPRHCGLALQLRDCLCPLEPVAWVSLGTLP